MKNKISTWTHENDKRYDWKRIGGMFVSGRHGKHYPMCKPYNPSGNLAEEDGETILQDVPLYKKL